MPDLAERGQLIQLGHRRDVAREGVVALAEVGERIAEPPPGVGHEMTERRALRGVLVAKLELGDVAPYVRIQIERATLDEAHDDRRRNGLRDRCDLEEGVG